MSGEKIATLVRMANQMADFFRPYPRETAIAGVRDHMKSFWTPVMRNELIAHAESGSAAIDPVVLAALKQLDAAAKPKPLSKARPKAGAGVSDAE